MHRSHTIHCKRNRVFSFAVQQGTSGPSRKPLKCRVMHHKVVAHQMCAVQMMGWLNKITNYSGLYSISCSFMLHVLVETVSFIYFCNNIK